MKSKERENDDLTGLRENNWPPGIAYLVKIYLRVRVKLRYQTKRKKIVFHWQYPEHLWGYMCIVPKGWCKI